MKIDYEEAGRKKVTLTVTDSTGRQDSRTRKFRVRAIPAFHRNPARTYAVDDLARLLRPW